ncbi:XRE family transcriptional regulator [Persephonella sp.]
MLVMEKAVDSNSIGSRIKKLIEVLGLSQRKFAKELNISHATISEYIAGNIKPSPKVLRTIEEKFNVNPEWLREGKGEMFLPAIEEEEEIVVPLYPDVQVSAGFGVEPGEERKVYVKFSYEFARKFLKLTSPNGLELVPVIGNSMEPTIPSGVMAVIKLYEKEGVIYDGGIYIIRIDNELFIKRIIRDPLKNRLILKSDNPDYEPIVVEEEDLDRVKIIGRFITYIPPPI